MTPIQVLIPVMTVYFLHAAAVIVMVPSIADLALKIFNDSSAIAGRMEISCSYIHCRPLLASVESIIILSFLMNI